MRSSLIEGAVLYSMTARWTILCWLLKCKPNNISMVSIYFWSGFKSLVFNQLGQVLEFWWGIFKSSFLLCQGMCYGCVEFWNQKAHPGCTLSKASQLANHFWRFNCIDTSSTSFSSTALKSHCEDQFQSLIQILFSDTNCEPSSVQF